MARLPQYTQQITKKAVSAPQLTTENNMGEAIGQFAQGAASLLNVQSQMQQREARDYVIANQNSTSVGFAEEKLTLSQTALTGSEYTTGVKTYIENQKTIALENAPSPKAAEATGKYYDALLSKELEQSIPVAARMNASNTAKVITESLEIGLNQTYRNPSDYQSSLDSSIAVIDSSDLPENVKEDAKAQYQEKLITQKLLGVININPKQAVKDIESGEYDSIDPSTLNQITSSARSQSEAVDRQAEINKQKDIQENEAARASFNAEAQSNLEIGVSRGEMGYVEIDKAYTTGMITPEKRTQLVKSVDAQIEGGKKRNNSIVQVGAAIDAGQPLDYRNTDHKTAVDDYYMNMPEESRANPDAVVSLIKSTKVIPSVVESSLNAGLKGSVEQVVAASDLVARMNAQTPETLSQLPTDTKAMGVMVSRLVGSGVSPAKAVELANNSIYNTTKEQKEVLKSQLNQKNLVSKKQSGFKSAVKKISPSWFMPSRTPSMDRMEASHSYLTDQYYLMTHDIDTAMTLATTDISSVWGSTWVNGKEQMSKYPVEKMYGNGEETDWIYNQLKTELKSIGVEGKYSLQSDSITSREDAPSYIIMTEQDGTMMPLMIDGTIQRYTPDFASTPEKVEADKQKERAMAAARVAEKYVVGEFRYKTKYGVSR